jgi:S1-C subfamily serine protease
LDSNGHEKSHSRNRESQHKKRVIIEVEENGDKKVIEWDGEGEMPKDMEQVIKEGDYDLGEELMEREGKVYSKEIRYSSVNSDIKVKMGIGINQGEQGVSIDYVEENSPASKAKLKPNDILLKIEDTYILSDDLVFQTLSRFNPGDIIKVTVLREGKEMALDVTLAPK